MITSEQAKIAVEAYWSNETDELPAMRKALEAYEQSKWISVKDRLPKPDGSHVIVRNSANAVNGFYTCSQQSVRLTAFNRQGITHWQPLPEFNKAKK